jgi:AmmeMemoRadiSam system protein B
MALVGCFVSPHPPIIVPEVGGAQAFDAEPTVRAMSALREKAAVLAPETIVILSPHASLGYDRMSVSDAGAYAGSLATFRAPQVQVEAEGDSEIAEAILRASADQRVPVGVSASRGDLVELDHGAMVPLVYIVGRLAPAPRLVLLAFSQLSLEQHVHFGEAIGEALLETSRRVLYVASSDLSHRLLAEGPYGFDPRGPQFDHAVADAFAAGDWQALGSIPREVVAGAGECGYRSLMVLSGIVAKVRAKGLRTENHLLSYEGPFGVGYLVGEVEVFSASN